MFEPWENAMRRGKIARERKSISNGTIYGRTNYVFHIGRHVARTYPLPVYRSQKLFVLGENFLTPRKRKKNPKIAVGLKNIFSLFVLLHLSVINC